MGPGGAEASIHDCVCKPVWICHEENTDMSSLGASLALTTLPYLCIVKALCV